MIQMVRKPEDPPLFYECHVFVCTNQRIENHPRGSCGRKGSEFLREYMKVKAKDMGLKRIRINSSGCLDRCELGPSVLVYPEGIWYRAESREDIDEILGTHIRDGGRVERLMMPKPI
jgi:(2Fe-2S) ferredoxin